MSPHDFHKVKIRIAGFNEARAKEDLPDLLSELRSRPWLIDSQAFWDGSINKPVIIIGYEFEDRLEDNAFDERSDCVIATMPFDEKLNLISNEFKFR